MLATRTRQNGCRGTAVLILLLLRHRNKRAERIVFAAPPSCRMHGSTGRSSASGNVSRRERKILEALDCKRFPERCPVIQADRDREECPRSGLRTSHSDDFTLLIRNRSDCNRIPSCSCPVAQNRHRQYCNTAVPAQLGTYIRDAHTCCLWSDSLSCSCCYPFSSQ